MGQLTQGTCLRNVDGAEQVDAADNTCASLSHAGCLPAHILSGTESVFPLSWFVLGFGRNRHAFAQLGVAADLQRSALYENNMFANYPIVSTSDLWRSDKFSHFCSAKFPHLFYTALRKHLV